MAEVSGSENDRIYLSEDFGDSWLLTGPTTETFRSLTASKDASVIFVGEMGALFGAARMGQLIRISDQLSCFSRFRTACTGMSRGFATVCYGLQASL